MLNKVIDVAEYILSKTGDITAMKLQKLVYYSQAWSPAFDDEPIFNEEIQAWAAGPVCRSLFNKHKGLYIVSTVGGNPESVTESAKERINSVIEVYGGKTAQWLSDLTHTERPWISARKGVPPTKNSTNVITMQSMKRFYRSLYKRLSGKEE